MEYTSLNSLPYYSDCNPLVVGLGYVLVDIRVIPQHGSIRVTAVIAKPADASDTAAIGVNDCARVHRVLLPRLEAILNTQDIYFSRNGTIGKKSGGIRLIYRSICSCVG